MITLVVQMPDVPDREDGGCAQITQPDILAVQGSDQELFVRLQSWTDDPRPSSHEALRGLLGHKLRITIEIID